MDNNHGQSKIVIIKSYLPALVVVFSFSKEDNLSSSTENVDEDDDHLVSISLLSPCCLSLRVDHLFLASISCSSNLFVFLVFKSCLVPSSLLVSFASIYLACVNHHRLSPSVPINTVWIPSSHSFPFVCLIEKLKPNKNVDISLGWRTSTRADGPPRQINRMGK